VCAVALDGQGHYFIDRDGDVFARILAFLRSGVWRVAALTEEEQLTLEEEAKFYMVLLPLSALLLPVLISFMWMQLILPTYVTSGVSLPSDSEVKAYNAGVESSELDDAYNRYQRTIHASARHR